MPLAEVSMSRMSLASSRTSAAFASILFLAGCQASIAVPPSELPALTNGEPETTGLWPTVTSASGERQVVYGHVEGVAIERKGALPLHFSTPLSSGVTGDRLKIRTAEFEAEVPLADIAGIKVEYDDYTARERAAGGVLIAGALPALLGGITTAAYGLTNDPGAGVGAGIALAGLGVSGIGLMMLLPGVALVKGAKKEPAKAAIAPYPGGARVTWAF